MKQLRLLSLALILINGLSALCTAQSQSDADPYQLSTASQLLEKEHISLINAFYDQGYEGEFMGEEEIRIYYKYFMQTEKEKGAILISTGRTEAALKYKELIYDLYKMGYSIYIPDHRGQGLSERMVEDPEMGYVDDYRNFVEDIKTLWDTEVNNGNHKKVYLLGHSMGGAIGLSYLEKYPDDFDAAAFSSPMLGLDWYVAPLAALLSGKTPKYAPGQGGYSDDSTKFSTNEVSGCKTRYYLKIAGYSQHPESRLGGASVQWLHECSKGMKKIHRNIEDLDTPVLIMTAENETVVNPKACQKFILKAEKLGKICRLHQIPDAKHELLMEKDAQRTEAIQTALDFFEKY